MLMNTKMDKQEYQQSDSNEVLNPGQKYFTRIELARILRISVRKVDSMIAAREIPVLRLGKSVRFRLEDVERQINETMLTRSAGEAQ